MKTKLLLFSILCLISYTLRGQSAFSGGDVSENNPYQIDKIDDLIQLAKDVNSESDTKHYGGEYLEIAT